MGSQEQRVRHMRDPHDMLPESHRYRRWRRQWAGELALWIE
jgi:hypothetical protein